MHVAGGFMPPFPNFCLSTDNSTAQDVDREKFRLIPAQFPRLPVFWSHHVGLAGMGSILKC
jgi:hypothetical protein